MQTRIFSHLFEDFAHNFGQPVMFWQARATYCRDR